MQRGLSTPRGRHRRELDRRAARRRRALATVPRASARGPDGSNVQTQKLSSGLHPRGKSRAPNKVPAKRGLGEGVGGEVSQRGSILREPAL
jgi:hypothetical protein